MSQFIREELSVTQTVIMSQCHKCVTSVTQVGHVSQCHSSEKKGAWHKLSQCHKYVTIPQVRHNVTMSQMCHNVTSETQCHNVTMSQMCHNVTMSQICHNVTSETQCHNVTNVSQVEHIQSQCHSSEKKEAWHKLSEKKWHCTDKRHDTNIHNLPNRDTNVTVIAVWRIKCCLLWQCCDQTFYLLALWWSVHQPSVSSELERPFSNPISLCRPKKKVYVSIRQQTKLLSLKFLYVTICVFDITVMVLVC